MHYEPGDIRPSLGDTALDTAAIIRVGGAAVSMDFDGDYALEATERIQALNATIMATEIYNDYVTDPDIAASTDWIMTFPTKICPVIAGTPIEPFSKLSNGQSACEPSKIGAVNREVNQRDLTLPPRFSRQRHPTPPTICFCVTSRQSCSLPKNRR